jgi:hypothetical protein
MNRCEHGVYDPHGDQKYCTVCNPIRITGEILKTVNTSVGKITIGTVIGKSDKDQHVKWEKTLDQEGFGIDRGSLGEPEQRDAALEYLEIYTTQVVPSNELPEGFSTSDEMTQQYLKEQLGNEEIED